MGSFPALYYYPLFWLWKSPVSARFMGYLFIALQAYLASKIFNIRFIYLLLGFLLFFPYAIQQIIDTGVIGLQATSIFLIYYLVKNWLKTYDWKYPILISIIIFIGIWTKLTYLWLLPGISIILLANIIICRKTILKKITLKRIIIQSIISSIILICLLSTLFFSTAKNNSNVYPYQKIIFKIGKTSITNSSGTYMMPDLLRPRMIPYLLNPYSATHRLYKYFQYPWYIDVYNFYLYLLIPLFSFVALLGSNRRLKTDAFTALLYFSGFVITVVIVLSVKSAWAYHHFVLSFPLLILSCLALLEGIIKSKILEESYYSDLLVGLLLAFVFMNIHLYVTFPSQNKIQHSTLEKNVLNEFLDDEYLAKNYHYVVIHWGMYYYQALYGHHDQSILYLQPFVHSNHVKLLRNKAKSSNRKLLFIYHMPTLRRQKKTNMLYLMDLEPCLGTKNLREWNIMLDSDDNTKNKCFYENSSIRPVF